MFSFFLYWACFEAGRRIFFSREIPCPHCGFDASWYKRDVKVARRKVDEFWQKGEADSGVVTPPPKDQFEENVQILN
jgi:ribosomal protein L37E